jgi:hypothetical protein
MKAKGLDVKYVLYPGGVLGVWKGLVGVGFQKGVVEVTRCLGL